jgi:UPF0755 protein
LSVLAVVIAIAIIGAAFWLRLALFSDRSHPSKTTEVVIPRGSSFRDITEQLASSGVIGNPLAFRLYAKMRREDTAVRAGEYRFAPAQTEAQILDQLLTGGAQVARWVTFPEGFTARQIAQRLQEEGFGDWHGFEAAFQHDSIVVLGKRTKGLEGYLFPSTYLIPIGATSKTVEQIMTGQFVKELPADAAAKAKARGLTIPQVVTLASLVQQEGKADE